MEPLHRVFREPLRWLTPRHADLWRNYEILYNLNDFTAGLLFITGSVLFFWKSTMTLATALFLVGSVLFCLRPGIRLARDLHLLRLPAPPGNQGTQETAARRPMTPNPSSDGAPARRDAPS